MTSLVITKNARLSMPLGIDIFVAIEDGDIIDRIHLNNFQFVIIIASEIDHPIAIRDAILSIESKSIIVSDTQNTVLPGVLVTSISDAITLSRDKPS